MRHVNFLPDEKWEIIPLPDGIKTRQYAISNYGRIISFYNTFETGRLLSGGAKNTDYLGPTRVKVLIDGAVHNFYTHKWVAHFFVPKPSENHTHIIHLDRNRNNNHYLNLCFATDEMYKRHLRGMDVFDTTPFHLLRNEQWKEVILPIPKQKKYAITNFGRLISYTNTVEDGILIHGSEHALGYRVWKIKLANKSVTYLIHRLVAEYFVEKPSSEHNLVIHLDYNRNNNNAYNLRWVTLAEQREHADKTESSQQRIYNFTHRSQLNGKGLKLTELKVKMIKKILANPKLTTRKKMIAKQFNISTAQLRRIETGENWAWVNCENE